MPRIIGRLNEPKEFEWEIPNFSSVSEDIGFFYHSPSFNFADSRWHVVLRAGIRYLSLYLYNETGLPIHVSYAFSIKDINGRLNAKKRHASTFEAFCGFPNFLLMAALEARESFLIPSDILTIVCKIKLSCDVEWTASDVLEANILGEELSGATSEQMKFTETDTLSYNLKNLFRSGSNCDTILKVNRKKFNVHRAILIARSTVFASMFRHDTTEKETGTIIIPDIDPGPFEKFLDFLYTGELEDFSFDDIYVLYSIADKYDVQGLKKFCSKYMMQNLTVENFCDVAALADRHNEMRLVSAVQGFFNRNVSHILETDEWKILLQQNLNLANKHIIEMSKSK